MATYIGPDGEEVQAEKVVGWWNLDYSDGRMSTMRDDAFRRLYTQKYPRAVDGEPTVEGNPVAA